MNTTPLMDFFTLTLPCTEDDLKSAFRLAARRLHPDVGGDPRQFTALTTEYQRLLKDPKTFSTVPLRQWTSDGHALHALGLGLGPTVNGRPCTACASRGYRRVSDYDIHTCPTCHNGRWQRFLCTQCRGNGWVQQPKVTFERCWECKGSGEIVVFNPVIPKGRLTGRL